MIEHEAGAAPTWDDLKQRRDGTLAPLITPPGMGPGEVAYRKSLDRKLEVARMYRVRAEEEVLEAEEKVAKTNAAVAEIEAEIKALDEAKPADTRDHLT